MKYLSVWLLGCVLGAGIGAAVLYYNPLLDTEPPLPASGDWVLSYRLPGEGAFTHGSKLSYPRRPAGIDELWEDTIESVGVGMFALEGGEPAAPLAAASRISVPSARSDFLTQGPLLSDYWLLTVPGEGSLFLEVDSALWPFFRDTLLPVRYLGRPWQGPATYEPTIGPRGDHAGQLRGATGRFRQATGSVIEKYRLEDFGATQARVSAELSMHLDPTAVTDSPQP